MGSPPQDAVSKLAALTGSKGGAQPQPQEQAKREEDAVEEINKVLKLLAEMTKPPGGEPDIFEMQALVEAAAEELRSQIREMMVGEPK